MSEPTPSALSPASPVDPDNVRLTPRWGRALVYAAAILPVIWLLTYPDFLTQHAQFINRNLIRFARHPNDWLLHCTGYGLLTVLLGMFARQGSRFFSRPAGILVLCLLVLSIGAADEISQAWSPWRNASWLDGTFDFLGILLGGLLLCRIDRYSRTTAAPAGTVAAES